MEDLSPYCYGFRHGRCTMKAFNVVLDRAADAVKWMVWDRHLCVLVTLDIRNALNSAPWRMIDAVIAGVGLTFYVRKLIRSYLSDRTILVSTEGRYTKTPMMYRVP